MIGNKIKMASPLIDDIVEYSDGTQATVDQMSKDVTTFLTWAAEPELEERHRDRCKSNYLFNSFNNFSLLKYEKNLVKG
jgi:hypothetical protein